MSARRFSRLAILLTAAAVLPIVGCASTGDAGDDKYERFEGRMLSKGLYGFGETANFFIGVSSWTEAEERADLLQSLTTEGPRAFHSAIERSPDRGFFRVAGQRATTIRYAWKKNEEGREILTLVAPRPVAFIENRANLRTRDYNVSIWRIIWEEGDESGRGAYIVGADVSVDKASGAVEIKQYDVQPIELVNVLKK